jgi:hypothetical protein
MASRIGSRAFRQGTKVTAQKCQRNQKNQREVFHFTSLKKIGSLNYSDNQRFCGLVGMPHSPQNFAPGSSATPQVPHIGIRSGNE